MKKLMTILLTIMMMFSLVSVVSADEDEDENKPTFSTETYKDENGIYKYSVGVTVTFPKGNEAGGRIYDICGKIGDEVIYHIGGSYTEETDASGHNMNNFFHILWGTCGETIEVTYTVYDGWMSDSTKKYSETYKINLSDDQADYEWNGHKFGGIYGGYEIFGNGMNGGQTQTLKLLEDIGGSYGITYTPENIVIDMNGHNLTIDNTNDYSEFNVTDSGNTGKIIFMSDGQARFSSDVTKYIPDGFETVKITDPNNHDTYYVVKSGTSPKIATGATGEDLVGVTNDVANDIYGWSGSDGFEADNVKTIEAELKDVDSTINVDDMTNIEEKAKEVMLDGKVSKYLDLTLKASDGSNTVDIVELSKATKVTLFLSDETNALLKGKEVEVIRLHNNISEKVDSKYDETNKTLTITSDKFSIYAIVTKEKVKDDNSNKNNNASNNSSSSNTQSVTRTEANTPCEEWHNSKNWTWSEKTKTCVYRVTNTSSK